MIGILNNLSKLASLRQTHMMRLATGRRINRGSDDPAGLIATTNLDATIKVLEAETAANHRAISMADTADAALGQMSSLLSEAKTLELANANDAGLSAAEKQANQIQIDSIRASADRIARTTSFNGTKLLDGSATISASGAKFAVDSAVGASFEDVNTLRGKLGGFSKYTLQANLHLTVSSREQITGALSIIRDVDYAMEISASIRTELLERSSMLLLKKSKQISGSLLSIFA